MTTARSLPPLLRATQHRALGGVAAGVAAHLGLDVLLVRLAFVALALCGGAGVLMYAALWVLVPVDPAEPSRAARPRGVGRGDRGQLLALSLLGAGGLLALVAGGGVPSALVPLAVVTGGVFLVWRQADLPAAQGRRWHAAPAVVGGALLVGTGLGWYLLARGDLQQARDALLPTLLVVLGLVLLSAPWWLRLSGDLREERRERIRSQERAELAARVHDSVLQTLTLIGKASADPHEVQRLVRTSERELRGWLYAPSEPQALRGALERVAAEVEERHGVAVETVVVGDAAPGPAVEALVAATREALVNAALHAGVPRVALYAESRPEQVEVFVRDRGSGFDPAAVPQDRHGLAGSVHARLARHGGAAEIRTAPGEGTEVHLRVPR